MDWKVAFEETGAFKFHSGKPEDPYFRLTSGKISNGFFDAGKIAERDPPLLGLACETLARMASSYLARRVLNQKPCVTSVAFGGIPIALFLAKALNAEFKYGEKMGDEIVFRRFTLGPRDKDLLVDDVFTTGSTFEKLERAIRKKGPPCFFYPILLVLCNRSGRTEFGGREIVSLIKCEMQTWNEGANPFTTDGKELVPPIHPKIENV